VCFRAIEVITSQTRKYTYVDKDGTKQTVSVAVWNPTIANLTLMALGSSAPEILLSLIETVSTLGSTPGELGPSTIVGSAAFNLLIITAVSIVSVGKKGKKIDGLGVFAVTTSASMFAYIWMWVCLQGITKDQIDLWEALLTLFFFVVLVVAAFAADKIKWCWDKF
jgi:solute carrier family 8 (sodium/calcium exchanger)